MLTLQLLCQVSQKQGSVNGHKSQKQISFYSVFVNSVNAQKRIFFSPFLYKNGGSVNGCWISTKTDKFENEAA